MPGPLVLFDIGATLIEGPAQTPARFIAARLGLNETCRKRLDRQLLTSVIDSPDRLATLLVTEYAVAEAKSAAIVAQEAWESQETSPTRCPGALELLDALCNSGLRYGFVSNIWFPYARSFARLFGKLAGSDVSIFSYRVGIAKPDPALFRHALAAAGCPASDCTMVGDSYENDIAPAIALGMRTIWLLHRPNKEQVELERVKHGTLPGPDLRLPAIAQLTLDHFTATNR